MKELIATCVGLFIFDIVLICYIQWHVIKGSFGYEKAGKPAKFACRRNDQ